MEIRLNESELIAQLVENKSKAEMWDVSGIEWVKLYESLSTATYEFLNVSKDKSKRVALVFTDNSEAHNFLMAGVIEYHEGTEEVGGNWSFTYTFNPQDIVDCTIKYSNDPMFITILNDSTKNSMHDQDGVPSGFTIVPEIAADVFDALLRYLIQYLDTNASTEVLDLVLEDHFKASVVIEDGIKVMAMSPCGLAKSKIKNDDEVSEGIE